MLPTKDEISRAIEDVNNLLIPQLHGYSPCEGIIGPESYAGGFCIVFPFSNGYDSKAVRVWHQEIDRCQERYSQIANDFSKASSRFLCDLRYYPSSLNVFGNTVDTVIMDWVKGKPLKEYIQSLIDNGNDTKIQLEELAEEALSLFREMHSKKFSHGDLQHDNLIITEYGRIKLVDYDSFYTPSLGTEYPQTTTGYSGYQHPERFNGQHNSSEKSDYFSELIIYMSLKALANDISLWKYAKDADYSFLFNSNDFADLQNSQVYALLYNMGEEMQIMLRILQDYLTEKDLDKLQPFDKLYHDYVTPPSIQYFICKTDNVYKDDEIELEWMTNNSSHVTLNGKNVTNRNSIKIKEQGSIYELYATNGHKDISQTIEIQVIDKPTIKFKANKTKLRKGKEDRIKFSWSVSNAASIKLCYDGVEEEIDLIGKVEKSFLKTTETKLVVYGLDGVRMFEKAIKIYVFSESGVTFTADKLYSLPGVPIELKWSVTHAKYIQFVGLGDVEPTGSTIVEPVRTTEYILKVGDVFGLKEYRVKIQMLPIPQIKVNVPTPDLSAVTNIDFKLEPPTFAPSFPNIDIMGIELKAPNVPSLTDIGLNVKLTERISKQINLWTDLKNLYFHYRKRLLKY